MADLAASQRSALETELKNAEDRVQLAEKNADLATSQRIGLEAELKKAQEKAQLAQKITDLVTRQSPAEENGLPSGGAPQKSADLSANHPKSGQAQPPNAGAPVRVQAVEDTPREANKGIGFMEATAPIDVGASPTPINQPTWADQERKFAQTTPGQAALPLPTPSVAVSAESASPDPQANGSLKALSDEQLIKKFVLDYLQIVSSDDVSTQENFFAHNVAYYDQGVISFRRVQEALESYDREWPTRDWKPQGEPKIRASANPRMYEVLQPFSWALSNGPRHAQGSATLYVKLWKNDKGEFHIIHVERRYPDSQSQNN